MSLEKFFKSFPIDWMLKFQIALSIIFLIGISLLFLLNKKNRIKKREKELEEKEK